MTDSPFPPFVPQPSPPTVPEQPAQDKPKRGRKPKTAEAKAAPKAASPKFDLQTILAAASTLHQDDFSLFERLIGMLDDAGKPARDRLLAAVNKVFA